MVVLAQDVYDAASNPAQTAGIIAAGAVCNPYVLGGILATQLILNHRELFEKSKKFGRLLFENTPEAMAELVAFCTETALLHQASTAVSKQYAQHVKPSLKEFCDGLATVARHKETISRSTQGFGGKKMALPESEFFNGFRDAVKRGMSEEGAGEKAIVIETKSTINMSSLNEIHIIHGDGSGPKGVLGAHNKVHFEKMLNDTGVKAEDLFIGRPQESAKFPGLKAIKYKLPRKDKTGKFDPSLGCREIKDPKTVYDPSIYSDQQIIHWGKEAMEEGVSAGRISSDGNVTGYATNGMPFQGYFRDGKITNFYPFVEDPT